MRFPEFRAFSLIGHRWAAYFPSVGRHVICDRDGLDHLTAWLSDFDLDRELQDGDRNIRALIADLLGNRILSAPPVERNLVKHAYSAHVHLTQRCNYRCDHCYMDSALALPNELTVREWADFFRTLARFNATVVPSYFVVTFSGGEPLTYSGFRQLAEETAGVVGDLRLMTNAALVDPDIAQFIATHFKEVQVSLDGPTPDANDSVRGVGTFRRTMRGFLFLAHTGVPLHVSMTVTPENLPIFRAELYPFLTWLSNEVGNLSVSVGSVHSVGRARTLMGITPGLIDALEIECFRLEQQMRVDFPHLTRPPNLSVHQQG